MLPNYDPYVMGEPKAWSNVRLVFGVDAVWGIIL